MRRLNIPVRTNFLHRTGLPAHAKFQNHHPPPHHHHALNTRAHGAAITNEVPTFMSTNNRTTPRMPTGNIASWKRGHMARGEGEVDSNPENIPRQNGSAPKSPQPYAPMTSVPSARKRR